MTAARFLSVFSSFAIDILILFNFAMIIGGLVYILHRRRRPPSEPAGLSEFPMVSVIVPARNEENVIRATVLSLLNQDYPADRYEIIVVNDNSTDATAEVLQRMQAEFPDRALRVLTTDETNGGKGKSNVLNMAIAQSAGSVIAVYDADNTPEPGALRLLVCALMADEQTAATVGKFRIRNRADTLLTRLIDQETLIFQTISQAGFWFFFHIGLIPGTNFVIRRSALEQVGGWDLKALSEDTEISYRILGQGKLIRYVPEAVTWEQEPRRLRAWYRQRNRWARGNLSLVTKNIPNLFQRRHWRFKFMELFTLLMYILLFFGVVFSDVVFFGNLFGLIHLTFSGPLSVVFRFSWVTQLLLYFSMAVMALWQEPEERSFSSLALLPLLLLGYAKLWIVIIIGALARMAGDALHHREAAWDKTVHLAENHPPEPAVSAKHS